ncbi:tripartite tricarboxylate transporter TctB family protein [Devosia sp. A449]
MLWESQKSDKDGKNRRSKPDVTEDLVRELKRELITALLFIGLGLAYGGWAYFHYDLGTLRRIGPGMFPVGLGAILCAIGVFIALPVIQYLMKNPSGETVLLAVADEGEADASEEPNTLRAGIFVLLSLVAFALVLPLFGAVPALFALVYTAVLAEPGRDWRLTPALIAGVLSLFVWGLFKLTLNLPLIMFKGPF